MNTKNKIFYTYGYMSKNGNVYYMGKGYRTRAYDKHGRVGTPKDRSKIIFFRKDSLHMYAEPQLMLEQEALDREIELIKHYGRKDLNEGHLLNLTDGGDGASGVIYGKDFREACRIRMTGKNNHRYGKPGVNGMLGKKHSVKALENMSVAQKKAKKGWKPSHLHTPEMHEKSIVPQRGVPRPQTSKILKAMYASGELVNSMKGKTNSGVSKALKGKPKSEEHKAKMRKPKKKSPCKHCGLLFAPNMINRWHNNNCKRKPNDK